MHWIFHLSLCSSMAVLQTHLTGDPGFIHLDGRYHCYHFVCYQAIYFVTLSPKGVPSWLIKEIVEVAPVVTLIMQASLDLGRITFSWKRHWSSRYFRKGNRSAESSNRPPPPPSPVRCVNTSSTVLTLVISLNMTPHWLTTWLPQKILWHPIHTYNPWPSER